MSVPITPGSGANIATDLVGSDNLQIVKIALGAEGAAELVGADNPVPVALSPEAVDVLSNNKPVKDSTGIYSFDPASLPATYTYAGPDGKLDTVTVGPDSNGDSFRQTMTFTGSNVTSVSAWVLVA